MVYLVFMKKTMVFGFFSKKPWFLPTLVLREWYLNSREQRRCESTFFNNYLLHLSVPALPAVAINILCNLQIELLKTEKSYWNLILQNRNQIVVTIFWLTWNIKITCPFDVPNHSEKGKYNLIPINLTRIRVEYSVYIHIYTYIYIYLCKNKCPTGTL